MAQHISVLADEVIALADPQPGQTVVDATVGVGGHSTLIWPRIQPGGTLIALDQDPTMLAIAQGHLTDLPIVWKHANFEDLPAVLDELRIPAVDAILADLGFCSDQMSDAARGLSFQSDGPLDMRLDPTRGEPASALIRRLSEKELADIFWQYGEERFSRRVARQVVETRKATPIATTGQLADLVRRCVPRSRGHAIDPATRVFQALRIAVNDELGALERFLQVVPDCLKPRGKVAIISFHSLEDRIVKKAFRGMPNLVKELTRKPVQASEQEKRDNPRSRSAKLRVAQRRVDQDSPLTT
ncbi:MAG: 16S rRNA (cytosine(1402)-N(4))-methyltransferase RsmH [Planctomycetes bacterium]|nr:16S rRNA (cytosine(1402)-N(4))-methyltransferase RsmH [Planctomycetota bacterium]